MSLEETLKRGFDAFDRSDYHTAAESARIALRESPQNGGAMLLMGRLALVSLRLDVALSIFAKMTEEPSPAEVWLDLARTLVALRRDAEAADAARGAARLDPDLTAAHLMVGDILMSLNDRNGAAEAYRQALAIDFAETRAYLGLARVTDLGLGSPEATRMRSLLSEPRLPKQRIADLHYALSFLYKRAGDDKQFIKHMFAANAAQKEARPGSRAFYAETFDRLETAFARARFDRASAAGESKLTPIFILGMPRSGTTLVEQIVGGHPQVATAGELSYTRAVLTPALEQQTGKQFPLGFETLASPKMNELVRPYLNLLGLIGDGKPFVTDKTPGNYHILGLLLLMCPNCKIVSLRRDPMDTCFSILQQPFDDRAPHTYDVELLAYVYARYERMMAIWESTFSRRIHTVRYEEFVSNPEEKGRELLTACGLDWDPRFLNFHTQDKAVHTFSTQQVRRSVNTESIGAWRKYERDLAPMRKALIAEGALKA